MRLIGLFSAVCLSILFASAHAADAAVAAQPTTVTSAIAEFGTPLYAVMPDHLPYTNPAALKRGSIVLGAFGSFDSLNQFILRGDAPEGMGMVDDSLMAGSGDELAVAYALIAQSVEYPADKSWALFTLNPAAKFQDGTPIVAADFKATLDAIRQPSGKPFLQSLYADIDHVETPDDHHLKFVFTTKNQMKPIIYAAGLSPLPRQWWAKHDLAKTTLDPVTGSGPYKISAIDPGRSITYTRVNDYWAADLPIIRGTQNFDTIRYDYYGDDTVMFEAFKAHKIDFRQENKASRWTKDYDIPQVADGQIVKRAVHMDEPQGIQGLFFNQRRPQFQDARVRHALALLFDFETTQRTLLNGQYKREKSYFPGSDYGASGAPSQQEIALLTPYKDQLPPEVLTQAFEPPTTDGSGNIRANLRAALDLFKQAGWELKGEHLTNVGGEVFHFEILLDMPAFERVMQPYVANLKRAGIDAGLRIVDTAQYQVRIDDHDFDAIELKSNFFPPPGAELRSYYGSAAADVKGSGNWAGIKDPVADKMIEAVVNAKDLDSLKAANRALDRVLLWQWYCVPEWYNDEAWIAYWNKFGHPDKNPRYGVGFPDTWWAKE